MKKWLSESKNRIKLSNNDEKKEQVYFRKNEKTNAKIENDIKIYIIF
jgi:predicted phage tail protein